MHTDALAGHDKGVLLSTIYFEAKWEWNFSPWMTHKAKFYAIDRTSTEIDMMTRSGYYDYGEIHELNSTVLSIPYKVC